MYLSEFLSLSGPWFLHLWPGRIGLGSLNGPSHSDLHTQVPKIELILFLVSGNTFPISLSMNLFCICSLFHLHNSIPAIRTTRNLTISYLLMSPSHPKLLTPPAILNLVYNSLLYSFTTCMHFLRVYYVYFIKLLTLIKDFKLYIIFGTF